MNTPVRSSRRHFLRLSGLALCSPLLARLASSAPAAPPLPDFGGLTLEQKVGQMVVARYMDLKVLEKLARQGLVSGVTPRELTHLSPAEMAEFTNRFQQLSPFPLLFGFAGVSYGGGTALRTTQLMRLGATRRPELCREAGRIEAMEARALGFHIAGGPVMDVNTNPDNTIINLRSFGDDPNLVTALGAAHARGLLEGGAAPLLAHFPGHGASRGDSHIEMSEISRSAAELESVDILPFAELIRRGLARLVHPNHCYYPALDPDRRIPATLSRGIITGLLREKLGFDGVILSDSLTMRPIKDNYGIEEAAILAVAAGHDLILQDYNSDPHITIDALARAVRQGRIPLAQVEQSVRRVWKLKAELGLFKKRFVDAAAISEVFATAASAEVARRIARESVTLLENVGGPLSPERRRVVVVSNASVAAIDEDTAFKHAPTNHHLNLEIRKRVPAARTILLSTKMTSQELARAAAAIGEADVVVFGLFTRVRAYDEMAIRLAKPLRELIGQAAAAKRTLALLNFGNPYIMAELPEAGLALCTFSDAEDSIAAAVEVLFGELKPRGKLPVRIPPRYLFGHGLSL